MMFATDHGNIFTLRRVMFVTDHSNIFTLRRVMFVTDHSNIFTLRRVIFVAGHGNICCGLKQDAYVQPRSIRSDVSAPEPLTTSWRFHILEHMTL